MNIGYTRIMYTCAHSYAHTRTTAHKCTWCTHVPRSVWAGVWFEIRAGGGMSFGAMRGGGTQSHIWVRNSENHRQYPISSCGLINRYGHVCERVEFYDRVFWFGTCIIMWLISKAQTRDKRTSRPQLPRPAKWRHRTRSNLANSILVLNCSRLPFRKLRTRGEIVGCLDKTSSVGMCQNIHSCHTSSPTLSLLCLAPTQSNTLRHTSPHYNTNIHLCHPASPSLSLLCHSLAPYNTL